MSERTQSSEPPPLEGEIDRWQDRHGYVHASDDKGAEWVWERGSCLHVGSQGPWTEINLYAKNEARRRLAAQLAEARGLLSQCLPAIHYLADTKQAIRAEVLEIARPLVPKLERYLAGQATATAAAAPADMVRVLVLHHPAVGRYAMPEPADEAGVHEAVRRFADHARTVIHGGSVTIQRFQAPSWEAWCRVMPPLEISEQSMPLLKAMQPETSTGGRP